MPTTRFPTLRPWRDAAALLLCALPFAVLAGTAPFARQTADLRQERQSAPAGEGLAVLFELADCPSCARLRQDVLAQPAARRALRGWRTVAVALDDERPLVDVGGETTTAADLARRLHVPGTPAFAFFDRSGRLLYRHLGGLRDARDLALLTRYVGTTRYEEQPFADYVRHNRGEGKALAVGHRGH